MESVSEDMCALGILLKGFGVELDWLAGNSEEMMLRLVSAAEQLRFCWRRLLSLMAEAIVESFRVLRFERISVAELGIRLLKLAVMQMRVLL
ncbi:hypothetical protein Droror1_Dr00002351 [Drosera rotundifolia]